MKYNGTHVKVLSKAICGIKCNTICFTSQKSAHFCSLTANALLGRFLVGYKE